MADRFTKVTQMSQTLERILETRFHAQGRGLHEKLSSVEDQIPEKIRSKIRFIATMRNKATHEDVNVAKDNFAAIQKAFDEVLPYLSGGVSFWTLLKRKLITVAIVAAALAIFYFLKVK